MVAIELTEKHKEKLLEMCKTLFPEYKEFYLDLKSDLGGATYLLTMCSRPPFNGITIHWFEFCMTHLLNKVCDYGVMHFYNATGYFDFEHPVDFLYEQFKKLK